MTLTKGLHTFCCVFSIQSNQDVGVSRDTVFEEARPGAGFETGHFVEENVGGATVERLTALISDWAFSLLFV